jgi:hypothetical protein
MLSRVLGSASIIAASESSQPIAAFGCELRIATASDAALGSRVHLNSSAGGGRRARRRAAGSGARCGSCLPRTRRTRPRPSAEAGAAARPLARIIAVSGSSQPRMGDQRSPAGMPSARCCGSNTATGPPLRRRARRVAVRLSGLVLVVTTAPGASRIALMTTCRPLPERGGPISRIESSTDAQTFVPRLAPRR